VSNSAGYCYVTDLPGVVGIPTSGTCPVGTWSLGNCPARHFARELREEPGIDIAAPSGPPVQEVRADTFDMQIWLIEAWMGSPINVAPDEHDAIAWFTEDALGELSLAHDSYLAIFSEVLAEHRGLTTTEHALLGSYMSEPRAQIDRICDRRAQRGHKDSAALNGYRAQVADQPGHPA
jgi:hypothetical protein